MQGSRNSPIVCSTESPFSSIFRTVSTFSFSPPTARRKLLSHRIGERRSAILFDSNICFFLYSEDPYLPLVCQNSLCPASFSRHALIFVDHQNLTFFVPTEHRSLFLDVIGISKAHSGTSFFFIFDVLADLQDPLFILHPTNT